MRLGTRLLWPLLSVVGLVMLAYGAYAAARRERQLLRDAQREGEAYATALGIALEYAFADREVKDTGLILDRISLEPKIYGVIVYDSAGDALQAAAPLTLTDAVAPERVQSLLRASRSAAFARDLRGEPVHSVFRSMRGPDERVLGVLEVVQPLAPIFREVARTRTRALMATLALGIAVSAVLLILVRRVVQKPLYQLLVGARALGRGELAHRIEQGGATELAALSTEFNRMAGHLQSAQADLLRQTEQRVALERDLRNAEKLAAVGNLAAGLAHEIAAPLNVVAGRAEMLRRTSKPRETQDRDLRIIIDQIARITVIVRNLLDFAHRREPHLEFVPLDSILRGAFELLDGELARARVEVRQEWLARPVIRADAQLMHQVFVNLLLNAVHSVEQVDGERRIELLVREELGSTTGLPLVIIEITDTGTGLSEDIADRLFEPFVTSKSSGEGTGLGLAVVHSIIEEHRGKVEAFDRARSESGARGARFRVTLPAAELGHG